MTTTKQYYVYILTNKPNGTLYIGVTNDLIRRVWEHKQGLVDGFTKKYQLKLLVYYESSTSIEEAIKKEKQMKEWKRDWKINKIERVNPMWEDLYTQIT
jgi:putative endonuclease